jgi:hypothetical protein
MGRKVPFPGKPPPQLACFLMEKGIFFNTSSFTNASLPEVNLNTLLNRDPLEPHLNLASNYNSFVPFAPLD